MLQWQSKENRTCNPNNLVEVPVSIYKIPTIGSSLSNSCNENHKGNPNPDLMVPTGLNKPPVRNNLTQVLPAVPVYIETTHKDDSNNNNNHCAIFSIDNKEPPSTCCNTEPNQTEDSTSLINISSDSDNTSLINTPQSLEKENQDANSSAELIVESSPNTGPASWATNFLMSVGAVQKKPIKLNLSTKKKEAVSNLTNSTKKNHNENIPSKIPTLTHLSYMSCTQDPVSKETLHLKPDKQDAYINSLNKPGNSNRQYTCDLRSQLHVAGGPLYPEQTPLPGNSTYIRSGETNLTQGPVIPMDCPNYLPPIQSNEAHSSRSSAPNVYPNYYEGHIRNIGIRSEKIFTSTYKIPKISSRNTAVASSRSIYTSSTETRVTDDKIDRYNEFSIESYEDSLVSRRRGPEDYLEINHTKKRKLNDGEKKHNEISRRQENKKSKKQKREKRIDTRKSKQKNRLQEDKKRKYTTAKKSTEKHQRFAEESKTHKFTKKSSKKRRHSSESTSDSPSQSAKKKKITNTSRNAAKSLNLLNKGCSKTLTKISDRRIDEDRITSKEMDVNKEYSVQSVVKMMMRDNAMSLLQNQKNNEYEEFKSGNKSKTTGNAKDLREKLSRRKLDDEFTACFNKPDYQPTRIDRDNNLVSVDNKYVTEKPKLENLDVSNNKKITVTKSKKSKEIKVVISIEVDNDDEPNNSDDSEGKNSDKSEVDLSFLDLIDVDDIVSCLKNCSNEIDCEPDEGKNKPDDIETLHSNNTVTAQRCSTPLPLQEEEPVDFSKDELAGIMHYLNNVSTSPDVLFRCENFERSEIHSIYPSNETLLLQNINDEDRKDNIRPTLHVKTVNELNSVEYSVQENNIENISEFINVNQHKHNICLNPDVKEATPNYINNEQSSSVETIIIDLDSPWIGEKVPETDIPPSPNNICTQDIEVIDLVNEEACIETGIPHKYNENSEKTIISEEFRTFKSQVATDDLNNMTDDIVQVSEIDVQAQTDIPPSSNNVCTRDIEIIDLVNEEACIETGIPHKYNENSEKTIISEEFRTFKSQVATDDLNNMTDDIVQVSEIDVQAQTDIPPSSNNVCTRDIEIIDLVNEEACIETGIPHKYNENSEKTIISEEFRTFKSQVATDDLNIMTDDIVQVSEVDLQAQTDIPSSPNNICTQDIEVINLVNEEACIETGIPHKYNENSEETSEKYCKFESHAAINDLNIMADEIVEVSEISVEENNLFDTARVKKTEIIKEKEEIRDTEIKQRKIQIAMATLDNQELQMKLGEISKNNVSETARSKETEILLEKEEIRDKEFAKIKQSKIQNTMSTPDIQELQTKLVEISENNVSDTARAKETEILLEKEEIRGTEIAKIKQSKIQNAMSTLYTQELQTKLGEISENNLSDTARAKETDIVIEKEEIRDTEIAISTLDVQELQTEISENNRVGAIVADDKLLNLDTKGDKEDVDIIEINEVTGKDDHSVEIKNSVAKEQNGTEIVSESKVLDLIGTVYGKDIYEENKTVLKDDPLNKDCEANCIIEESCSASAFDGKNIIEKVVNNSTREEGDTAIVEIDSTLDKKGRNYKAARVIEMINNYNAVGKDVIVKDEDNTIREVDKSVEDNQIIYSYHDKANSETPIPENKQIHNADSECITIKKEDMASKDSEVINNIEDKVSTGIERKIKSENFYADDVLKVYKDNTVFNALAFRGDGIEIHNVDKLVKQTESEEVIIKKEHVIMTNKAETCNIFGNKKINIVSDDNVSEENNAVIINENKSTLAKNESLVKEADNPAKRFDEMVTKDHREQLIRKSDEKGAIRTSEKKTRKTRLTLAIHNDNKQKFSQTGATAKPSHIVFDSLDQSDETFLFDSQKAKNKPRRHDHYRKVLLKNMKPSDKMFSVKLEKRMNDVLRHKFLITAFIRKGRFSKIYHCKDGGGRRDLTVKVMDSTTNPRFVMAKNDMITKLQHEIPRENLNFVYLHDIFRFEDNWCFLMEYCSKNLWQVFQESKASFHIDVVQILSRQLVTAVVMLRNNHIVHGEIDPSHILLTADNRLKLCGFENAFNINDPEPFNGYTYNQVSRQHKYVFTNYLAPELLMGFKIDYSVDIWTTAMVMLQMATKQTLVTGINNPNELLYKLQSVLGSMPRDMIATSKFTDQHFIRGPQFAFIHKRDQDIVPSFCEKPNYICKLLHNAYRGSYEQQALPTQRKAYTKKLMSMNCLLESMLVLHPMDRMPIEFVYGHRFFNIIHR